MDKTLPETAVRSVGSTAFTVLAALSLCHLLNDLVQSLVPALYPIIKVSYHLNFAQIGLITLSVQVVASLLQPFVGWFADRRPLPYTLAIGMCFTLTGLILVAMAPRYEVLLAGAAVIGMGSAVFHPESSRMARLASGGRPGTAQALFQVGGNAGSSLGPLLAAFIIVPHGQRSLEWFAPIAMLGIVVLVGVARWYIAQHVAPKGNGAATPRSTARPYPKRQTAWFLAILLALTFSKYIYLSSLTSYYMLYLIHRFHISVQHAQFHLFAFLGAVALGTFVGGPIGDRIGRKYVVWASILGILPFTLLLPEANLFWSGVLSVIIGFVLASAFSAILVYAQELVPGRVGLISGLFFGFAFGIGGLGAAALGLWADKSGIVTVYRFCAFLPAVGLIAAFLPNLDRPSSK